MTSPGGGAPATGLRLQRPRRRAGRAARVGGVGPGDRAADIGAGDDRSVGWDAGPVPHCDRRAARRTLQALAADRPEWPDDAVDHVVRPGRVRKERQRLAAPRCRRRAVPRPRRRPCSRQATLSRCDATGAPAWRTPLGPDRTRSAHSSRSGSVPILSRTPRAVAWRCWTALDVADPRDVRSARGPAAPELVLRQGWKRGGARSARERRPASHTAQSAAGGPGGSAGSRRLPFKVSSRRKNHHSSAARAR